MKIIDSLQRAWRSLGNAKTRTLLTSLAIAVGAFTLTLALAGGTGARHYADKLISTNVSKNMIMVYKDKAAAGGEDFASGGLKEYSDDVGTSYGYTMKMITQSDVDELARRSDVSGVVPFYSLSVKYVQIEGSDKKYVTQIASFDPGRQYTVAAGSLPATGTPLSSGEATVPDSFAKALKVSNESLVGKKITLTILKSVQVPSQDKMQELIKNGNFAEVEKLATPQTETRVVTIRAVLSKGMLVGSGTATSGITVDDSMARDIAEITTKNTDNYQKYYSAVVTVKDANKTEEIKQALQDKGYGAQSAKDVADILFKIVSVIQTIIIIFGILTLLASVFGIINTQYISVLERTREIGLMKALGMRGRHVRRLFQYEAAWIGFLGGAIGAIGAWALGSALNPWISDKMGLGSDRILIFEFLPIAVLVLGLMLVAMIAGWFPAHKAAKLDPIEALRTE